MKTPMSFRPATDGDADFLFELFASTRVDITLSDIPLKQKRLIMRQQFHAQTTHYASHFSQADFLIVMQGKTRIGRLVIDRDQTEIRVIDIAILPQWRGQGIGTRLMTDILTEGRVSDRPVRLHAEKMGRVVEFYRRLGFEVIEEKEMHFYMECSPSHKLII